MSKSTLCEACSSTNLAEFMGEIAIHRRGLKDVAPTVFVFAELVVCLDCGITQFIIPNEELDQLQKRDAASG